MSEIIPPSRPQRPMAIHGLVPRLPERGRLKIGGLGEERKSQSGGTYRRPIKYDHFVITTLERGKDGNFVRDEEMHKRFGETPTEIPVRLLYDDPTLNFPARYACFKGRTLWCVGDGQAASRLDDRSRERYEVPCTCELLDPTIERKANELRCKPNGALSVLIDGASGLGGVWKFRTTSYNSIVELLSTMEYLRTLTGGPLANIPLRLTVRPRQATNPVSSQPVQIFVVSLEYPGSSDELTEAGHRVALRRAEARLSIEHIEAEARRVLALPSSNLPLPGDDAGVVDEFYSEQVTEAPPRPKREQFAEPAIADPAGENPAPAPAEEPPVSAAALQVQVTTKEMGAQQNLPQNIHPPAADGEASATIKEMVFEPTPMGSEPHDAEPDDGLFCFTDSIGEVHFYEMASDAIIATVAAMDYAPDQKTLDALGDNFRTGLSARLSEPELAEVRKAYAEAKARLKHQAEVSQAASRLGALADAQAAPSADPQPADTIDPFEFIDAKARAAVAEGEKSFTRFYLNTLQDSGIDPALRQRLREKRPEYLSMMRGR